MRKSLPILATILAGIALPAAAHFSLISRERKAMAAVICFSTVLTLTPVRRAIWA